MAQPPDGLFLYLAYAFTRQTVFVAYFLKRHLRLINAEEGFNFEDDLFRSQNLSIETMQRATAKEYLKRLKGVNQIAFEEAATDYVSRLSEPIGILVLSIISMMMNYSYKKNVLLFSIVQSLSIAVVYYVAEMVFTIASRQGAISYYTLIYLPTLITIILSYVVSLLAKRI